MSSALKWMKHVSLDTATYDVFCECVEEVVVDTIYQMAKNPKECQERTEDSLSLEFVKVLRALGFGAEFDSKQGGHCDLLVNYGSKYTWIGEAKKYTGYTKLLKGYLQLTTRYSTGQPNDCRGAVLIYFFVPDTAQRMNEWLRLICAHYAKNGRRPIKAAPLSMPANSFLTEQPHKRTSLPHLVNHYAIPLHWDPEDK
ncbi:MAG: hypothetical protein JNM58_14930 [Xanthomonadaceae bacterium]|nr:hypothetical protein [Xanthomonadaceae bacterium]